MFVKRLKVLDNIKEKHIQLMTNARKLDNELPYSNWLQKHLKIALDPFGFVVNTQAKEIKPTVPVNEYNSNQPDLLIILLKNLLKLVEQFMSSLCIQTLTFCMQVAPNKL